MAEETRIERDLESRESEKREQAWVQAPILPVPHPRDGIDHRWVRSSMRGQSDNINVSQALRDGWEPVLAVDYPELQVINDRDTPSHIGDKIRDHVNREVKGQMEAVDRNYFREESARMPMLEAERRTRSSQFGDD